MIIKSLDHLKLISHKIVDNVSEKDCIFLIGEIGVGKTTFSRNFINHLQKREGVEETEVLSPTFNLLYEYDIKNFKVMHYDLYRIKNTEELDQLGIFKEDFNLIKIFIEIPKSDLLKKISKRTDLMFQENCLVEVKKFNKLSLDKNLSANKLIGVQEINQFFKGSIKLDECKELINIKTRQYAKRQNTLARGHMKNWIKLYSKNFSILLKKTLKVVS